MTVETEDARTAGNAFRESFDSFYKREFRSVVGLAYVLSGRSRAAEDLAQDAFLAAFRQWERIAGYDDPGAWVRRVVSNRAVSRIRRSAAEARAVIRLGGEDHTVPEADPDAIHLWAEVRRLPTRQAQVIALKYYDGQPISDIARILGCSDTTVKTHLERAKSALARRLQKDEETS